MTHSIKLHSLYLRRTSDASSLLFNCLYRSISTFINQGSWQICTSKKDRCPCGSITSVSQFCHNYNAIPYMNRNVKQRTYGHVRPAKIKISLGIRVISSESSLGAFRIAKFARLFHADNENSNQTARMRSLIWGFVGLIQKVSFLRLVLLYLFILQRNITTTQCYWLSSHKREWIHFLPDPGKIYLGAYRQRNPRPALSVGKLLSIFFMFCYNINGSYGLWIYKILSIMIQFSLFFMADDTTSRGTYTFLWL